MSHERRQRHLKILELVATRPLHTQEEVADALSQEGWDVTQSSVSRDIAVLGLVKSDGIYQRPAVAGLHEIADPNQRRIAESLLSVETAGDALLVLHTPPGEAQRVGSAPRTCSPGRESSALSAVDEDDLRCDATPPRRTGIVRQPVPTDAGCRVACSFCYNAVFALPRALPRGPAELAAHRSSGTSNAFHALRPAVTPSSRRAVSGSSVCPAVARHAGS